MFKPVYKAQGDGTSIFIYDEARKINFELLMALNGKSEVDQVI